MTWILTASIALLSTGCSADNSDPPRDARADTVAADGKPPVADSAQPAVDSAPAGDVGPTSDGAAGSVTLSGTFKNGAPAPAGTKVVLLWTVSAGSPDYGYKHGELQAVGQGFTGTVTPPPAEALNRGKYGVANLVLISGDLPDGRIDDTKAVEQALIGGAETHAVIYLAEPLADPWFDRFEQGFGCGKVAAPLSSGSFDTFEPTDCGALEITITPDPDWPNWT